MPPLLRGVNAVASGYGYTAVGQSSRQKVQGGDFGMGDALCLEPRLGPKPASLLKSPALLHTLVDALGSPLAVVLPEQIAENLECFRTVYINAAVWQYGDSCVLVAVR
jgi:hypothetical protein